MATYTPPARSQAVSRIAIGTRYRDYSKVREARADLATINVVTAAREAARTGAALDSERLDYVLAEVRRALELEVSA